MQGVPAQVLVVLLHLNALRRVLLALLGRVLPSVSSAWASERAFVRVCDMSRAVPPALPLSRCPRRGRRLAHCAKHPSIATSGARRADPTANTPEFVFFSHMAECSSTYPARRSPLRTRLCALQRHNHTDTLLLGHAGHTTSGIRAGPRCRAAHTGVRRPQKGACQCRHFVVCIETTANRIECAAARREKRRGREGKRACLQSFYE